jgi:hypothetical protein
MPMITVCMSWVMCRSLLRIKVRTFGLIRNFSSWTKKGIQPLLPVYHPTTLVKPGSFGATRYTVGMRTK